MNLHRKVIELMYEDSLTVTEYRTEKNEKTKLMENVEVVVLEGQPCKLSYEKIAQASQSDTVASIMRVTKVFLAPEIEIKAGSKLTVTTKAGVVQDYKQSGIPAVYPTHQEIVLEAFERWA